MTVTVELVLEVRRMVNEPTEDTYSDSLIESFIEKCPIRDELGTEPYYYETLGAVPTKTYNTDWIPTYNLNQVASSIWYEKAAVIAGKFDFSADGGTYNRSQAYTQAMNMAKLYKARAGVSTIHLIKSPDEPYPSGLKPAWIGNLPESD